MKGQPFWRGKVWIDDSDLEYHKTQATKDSYNIITRAVKIMQIMSFALFEIYLHYLHFLPFFAVLLLKIPFSLFFASCIVKNTKEMAKRKVKCRKKKEERLVSDWHGWSTRFQWVNFLTKQVGGSYKTLRQFKSSKSFHNTRKLKRVWKYGFPWQDVYGYLRYERLSHILLFCNLFKESLVIWAHFPKS